MQSTTDFSLSTDVFWNDLLTKEKRFNTSRRSKLCLFVLNRSIYPNQTNSICNPKRPKASSPFRDFPFPIFRVWRKHTGGTYRAHWQLIVTKSAVNSFHLMSAGTKLFTSHHPSYPVRYFYAFSDGQYCTHTSIWLLFYCMLRLEKLFALFSLEIRNKLKYPVEGTTLVT